MFLIILAYMIYSRPITIVRNGFLYKTMNYNRNRLYKLFKVCQLLTGMSTMITITFNIISYLFRIEESTNVFTFTCTVAYNTILQLHNSIVYSLCKVKVTVSVYSVGG